MKTPKIVVVGSINTDMVVKSERIPTPGETVTGGEFVMPAGGKGANQAVAAARLGAEVTLVAKVGQDMFGSQSVENFQRGSIRTDFIFVDADSHTGVALILVDSQGENLISVAPGANATITPDEVQQAADRIGAADVVLLQLEIPLETVEFTARLASEAGVTVVLDPAPAAPLGDELLRNVTYLTPNESEATRLTGVEVTDEATARAAAEKLIAAGVDNVIVTMGTRGALVATGEGALMIPSHAVKAVDSTAAGDAFNGGLARALAQGMALEDAVREAALVGAISVTKMGAQPSLPTADALEEFRKKLSGS